MEDGQSAERRGERGKKRKARRNMPTTKEQKMQRKRRLLAIVEQARGRLPFLSSTSKGYAELVARSYSRFKVLPRSALSQDTHARVHAALVLLLRRGLLQRSDKFVHRALLGAWGSTFRTQSGLKQFPIPWDKSQQYDSQVVDALRTIFSLDRALRAKADLMKAPGNGGGSDGSAVAIGSDRHMCLINYHDGDPNNTKAEPYYGMGRTAISWHVDKGTEKGSSIMCYNHSMSRNGADAGSDASAEGWSIAMKVAWDVDTPAICTRLKDGETYYMLGRFNDTHAHAVIAGTCPRFSTTHRTIILRPCDVLSNVVASAQKAIETVREWKWSWRRLLSACGVVFHSTGTPSPESEFTYPATEDLTTVLATADHIEFEWIRPFWLHGAEYASARPDWTREMEMLEDVWFALEGHLVWVVEIAVGRSSTYSTNIIDRARVLLCVLQERQRRRNVWKARYDNIVAPATLGKDSDSVSKDSARACIQRPLSSERGGIGESVPEIREQSGQDCKGDARIDATKSVQFGSLGCVRVRRESRGDCVALQYDLGVTLSRVRAAIA